MATSASVTCRIATVEICPPNGVLAASVRLKNHIAPVIGHARINVVSARRNQLPLFAPVGIHHPNGPTLAHSRVKDNSVIGCPVQSREAILTPQRAKGNLFGLTQISGGRNPDVRLNLGLDNKQGIVIGRQAYRVIVSAQVGHDAPHIAVGIRDAPQLATRSNSYHGR